MSEITPNTPNPVREDAYVEELSEKLGIDPQYIPKSPVWRNEEEIKAIAEMFANMSGGSSGGGVLVVHETVSDTTHTLDKTWQEIVDAGFAVLYIVTHIGTDVYALYHFGIDSGLYEIWFNGPQGLFTYSTDSATGYPSYEE